MRDEDLNLRLCDIFNVRQSSIVHINSRKVVVDVLSSFFLIRKTLVGPSSATLPDGLLETLVTELASCRQQCRDVISDWEVLQYATQIVQVLIATCR